jgi:hypothetical protein
MAGFSLSGLLALEIELVQIEVFGNYKNIY